MFSKWGKINQNINILVKTTSPSLESVTILLSVSKI